ncbi:hypothetical protein [Stigmatella aurantiaca]|uniref:Conserved uncharacterized protein n=1 Tax=Stigmatella aurantiaca (strain DW4/3-1) TaxID=378806 RepID=Q08RI3_STIAD|nr:hypothetical protein [Stigmatella aurantiaca]ADO75561.1 conserved uncharacterized protein [Stigmatella aurantiaca DW4/3-1]EAU63092.1 hypothetical protein STIAU_3955 [Stigmatella aurantiaca DW4/3-1]
MTAVSPPPPGAPPPKPGILKWVLIGVGTIVVTALVVGAFILGRRGADSQGGAPLAVPPSRPSGPPSAGATVEGMPEPPAPTPLEDVSEQGAPAVWVDVYAPARVRQVLLANTWLQEQMKKPLGQGFASSWAAFFGTTGADLKASFREEVFDLVAGKLLDVPFRVQWFVGPEDSTAPAFIVPGAPAGAVGAFEAMEQVAHRGGFTAGACPAGASSAIKVPEGGFQISRWLVAEQSLYAGRSGDRLVLARQPAMVLRGLCAEVPELEASKGVDLEVGFHHEHLGRELALLSHALGLKQETRLHFAAEGSRLVARGISGPLADEVRLDTAPLSDELLKLIPAETPVLLALQLKLPETLEASKVQAYWKGEDAGAVLTRQVALVWTPRGDAALNHEFALLWGRTEDAPALERIFNGGNKLFHSTLCSHRVLSSSLEVLQRLQNACEGQSPNLLNAAGPVVAGLRAPGSMTLGVNTGPLLGQLAMDGYWSEQRLGRKAPVPKSAPPEIEAARRDLETLPFVGLRGTVKGDSLVPGGFGS